MIERTLENAWSELVEELTHLESILPPQASVTEPTCLEKRFELEEEVRDLEDFIASAGEPDDQQSLAALTFLQTEMIRKRSLLDSL